MTLCGNRERYGQGDSKGRRKLDDSGGWLLPAVEGHHLEKNRIELLCI